jgi:hypothetical protein
MIGASNWSFKRVAADQAVQAERVKVPPVKLA